MHILDAVTIRKIRTFSHLDPHVISVGLSYSMQKPSVGIAQKIDFGGRPCESWVEILGEEKNGYQAIMPLLNTDE